MPRNEQESPQKCAAQPVVRPNIAPWQVRAIECGQPTQGSVLQMRRGPLWRPSTTQDSGTTPTRWHRWHHLPRVGLRVVALHGIQSLGTALVEASDGVDLAVDGRGRKARTLRQHRRKADPSVRLGVVPLDHIESSAPTGAAPSEGVDLATHRRHRQRAAGRRNVSAGLPLACVSDVALHHVQGLPVCKATHGVELPRDPCDCKTPPRYSHRHKSLPLVGLWVEPLARVQGLIIFVQASTAVDAIALGDSDEVGPRAGHRRQGLPSVLTRVKALHDAERPAVVATDGIELPADGRGGQIGARRRQGREREPLGGIWIEALHRVQGLVVERAAHDVDFRPLEVPRQVVVGGGDRLPQAARGRSEATYRREACEVRHAQRDAWRLKGARHVGRVLAGYREAPQRLREAPLVQLPREARVHRPAIFEHL
mmetsp:Transcript_161321/g.517888  ORF Transcript_161321/g.517888 Transcript_161321/m.517888 type:complete len:426 (-) Transcript_161321:215-1492(-)